MSKTILFEVFELLKSQRLVSTENEFSKDWLARSESYVRGLRFHDAEPSIATMALLASKLQHYGQRLIVAENKKQIELGHGFLNYSQACHDKINSRCTSRWINVMNAETSNLHRNF